MNGVLMRSRKKSKDTQTNENENTMTHNLWDTAKAVLRRKFIAYRPTSRNKINSNKRSNLVLKRTRKRTANKARSEQKEGNNKIRTEINEIESRTMIQKINEPKSQFFERINKIDRPLTRLIEEKRERTQINKIRNEREEITMDSTVV